MLTARCSLLIADGAITPPEGFTTWLACALFALFIVDKIQAIRARNAAPVKQQREIVGDSITIKQAVVWATQAEVDEIRRAVKVDHIALRADLEKMRERLDQVHAHIDSQRGIILEAGEERQNKILSAVSELRDNLHNRITDAMAALAELRGEFNGTKTKRA